MKMKSVIGLFVLASAVVAAELPVRKVTLYKHGVGYFERSGQLATGETARLEFKASEMDDVLKSLTVETRGGGVAGVRYDSSQPLAQKLEELSIKLGQQQSIAALLDQLKGAALELKYAGRTVTGAIVSARLAPATRDQNEREQVTLLREDGSLETLDLAGASGIRFPDPGVQSQLTDYLSALGQARSREKRSVYVDAGQGARQLIASYMIPMPVWKSSYRLILGATGEPVLEGWAIVDNTTGDDWSGVQLSLVSGRPISFLSRLYEPRYLERPVAELEEERSKAPVVHAGAIPPPAPMMAAGRLRENKALADAGVAEAAPMEARQEMASSVIATSAGRELGELFEYRFERPVSVRKNESVMLPFLQQKLAAQKMIIYSDQSQKHPLNAFELENRTGKTLDGGPITVFDAGAYAGEALMETLKTGDKRLISYGVDLGTRITTAFKGSEMILREVHFRRGILQTRASAQQVTTYMIHNVDSRAKTLVVEHPSGHGFELVSPKPKATTLSAYRFEVPLGASATREFPVTLNRMIEQSYTVTNLTPDFLLSIVQNKEISAAARKQLEAILALKRQIADTDAAMRTSDKELNESQQDQERTRQNIASLSRVAGQQEQVQKYAQELSARETRIAMLRDQTGELRRKKTALESELASLIEKMEF
jgi:hypothetical protein